MDDAELAALISRAQRREPAAFDALVGLYSTRLYGYFYRLTGSRDDADDLLQEVFVRLVRRIDRYEHDGRFDGWLFRIATNLVRDRVRRRRVARPSGQDSGLKSGADQADPFANCADASVGDPSDGLARSEQIDDLQRALGELPEAEREVILMRHFSEMTFRDIAEVMDTPLGTALARAHRGLARLRELLSRNDAEAARDAARTRGFDHHAR